MEEEESRERCNQCDFRGQGPREVFLHSASEHHFTERYECDFCQSLYSIKEQVIQHIIQKHENDPVPQQPGKKSNVKAEEGKEVYKVIKVEAPPMKAEPAVSLPVSLLAKNGTQVHMQKISYTLFYHARKSN